MEDQLSIFIVSDSLGETARALAKACIYQFPNHDHWEFRRFSYINRVDLLDKVFEEARQTTAFLMFSLVDEKLASYAEKRCQEEGFVYVDLLTNVIKAMASISGAKPLGEPGILRRLDNHYFKRVDAIEFAVKYDDGKDPRGILKADVILLGVSRTSKTPLSMYLADKQLKVVNIPLVPEIPIPKELSQVSPKRIIGLTNSPEKLNHIRSERLKALGVSGAANYAKMDRILEELDYADAVMKSLSCPVINVAHKAIEETASIILELLTSNGVTVVKDYDR
ncbi:pyruvate, water dikinase regulatory protein [Streptococcus dysgalactiae]|uniref:Putative pyruvate, phosphate dikinase regulatory protein n=1 Tax=Streptococcus dysgalactiae subsp. equisimilis TaxID=119602 RepID=A0A9X8XGA6_STREQ|nr:pyruvate, water dikinase regulatory protein [Streptococcus dysgalactiae]MDO5365184.1 pyruvate, water dikinase regulatory protein [Streptococcus dysgalactiae]SQF67631.1 phosphotransferase CD2411 [Streptococcus dysgalactiae subsp. equisimilis]VEF05644.1 phosphotransferase CD2411 [Streptococcus dysgalactiae subsp. equisimilis]